MVKKKKRVGKNKSIFIVLGVVLGLLIVFGLSSSFLPVSMTDASITGAKSHETTNDCTAVPDFGLDEGDKGDQECSTVEGGAFEVAATCLREPKGFVVYEKSGWSGKLCEGKCVKGDTLAICSYASVAACKESNLDHCGDGREHSFDFGEDAEDENAAYGCAERTLDGATIIYAQAKLKDCRGCRMVGEGIYTCLN